MSDLIDFAELQESARSVLAAECSSEKLHKFIDDKADLRAGLRQTLAELGWFGLPVAEDHGGLGLGSGDLAAIYYELGRVAAPSDFLGCMLVAQALQSQPNALAETLLPALASGELSAAVWGLEQAVQPAKLAVTATRQGDTVTLNGKLSQIADANGADVLLLPARNADGALLWVLLDLKNGGVELQPAKAFDRTRSFGALALNSVQIPADRVVAEGHVADALAAGLLDHAAMAIACDSIGGAEAIFEKTLAYLNTRKQFNRLIGSFQALKHRCSNLKVALVASGVSVEDAVQAVRDGGAAGAKVSMAKAYAADVYAHVAAESVQLHGGIGFTWEQDCHIYLKRAKLNQQLFGNGGWYRDRAATQLLAGAAAKSKQAGAGA